MSTISDKAMQRDRDARSIRRTRNAGLACLAAFGGGFGVWASTATLASAVIAPGQFIVESSLRKVQHQNGGNVGSVHVREGDRVRPGDLMVRLDDTLLKTNHAILVRQQDELEVRRARLMAERDGLAAVTFPATLEARRAELGLAALMDAEVSVFESRRTARAGQKDQLRQRIEQLRNEAEGYRGQQQSKAREAVLIARELEGVRSLLQNNLVTFTRAVALEREAVSLDGVQNQLSAQIAQSAAKVAETEIQITQIDEALRNEVVRELTDLQNRMAEIQERRAGAANLLERVDLRASVEGVVQKLAVHAPGDVVAPGEPVLWIVPTSESLFLDVRVSPNDYDQVRLGQRSIVKIHTGNPRLTPDLTGEVVLLAADTTATDPNQPRSYAIRVKLDAEELSRLGGQKIVSGMSAEVFLETAPQQPIDYLMKPLRDQLMRALRER